MTESPAKMPATADRPSSISSPSRPRFKLTLDLFLKVLVIATLFQAALHFLVFVDLFSPVLPSFLGEVNQLAGSRWLIGLWQEWDDDQRWQGFFTLQLFKIASLLTLWWSLVSPKSNAIWKRASYASMVFSSFFILHLAAPMQNAGDRLLWILWILCAPYFLKSVQTPKSNADASPHWADRLCVELLRAQAVFLYAGAALSKLADGSWRNGYAPALSLVSPAASNPLLPIGPWLMQLEWAPGLMIGVGWLTICTEAFIAIGLCLRRTRNLAIGLALTLHMTLLFTHSVLFVQLVSIITLLAWRILPLSLSEGPKQR